MIKKFFFWTKKNPLIDLEPIDHLCHQYNSHVFSTLLNCQIKLIFAKFQVGPF